MAAVLCIGQAVQDFVFTVDALLAARVGDDSIADIIVAELESYGVDCLMVKRHAKRSSSVSAVIVDAAGERLIMNYLDPDLESPPSWLPNELADNIGARSGQSGPELPLVVRRPTHAKSEH